MFSMQREQRCTHAQLWPTSLSVPHWSRWAGEMSASPTSDAMKRRRKLKRNSTTSGLSPRSGAPMPWFTSSAQCMLRIVTMTTPSSGWGLAKSCVCTYERTVKTMCLLLGTAGQSISTVITQTSFLQSHREPSTSVLITLKDSCFHLCLQTGQTKLLSFMHQIYHVRVSLCCNNLLSTSGIHWQWPPYVL